MGNHAKFILGLIVGGGTVALISLLILSAGFTFGVNIAIINIQGMISASPSFLTETISPADVLSMIKKVEESPFYKGALFQINSPGGSVVASREIAYAIKRMKKPSVCWLGDVAASGAYWVASSCDHIVADPLSLTGSIGVSASYLQFARLFEKYGVTYEQIVSGERKDIGSPYRNLTSEEREKLEYVVNETFRYFLDDVIKNRNLNETQVERITSGDIFLGKDGVELGLIDSLGTFEDAKEIAKRLTRSKYPNFVTLGKKRVSLFDLLGML
jgi:protease-4